MGLWKAIATTIGWSDKTPRGRSGMRAYGVGDLHGRLDLLDALLVAIGQDIASRPPARNFVVFLGDLIDRGPDSRGVVERLRTLEADDADLVFLLGNHEEIMLRALAAEPGVLESWLRFGGGECAQSYGVDPLRLAALDEVAGAALLRRHIPENHVRFLRSFGDTFRFGDYLFVHAGIRPGVALDDQSPQDLRWIREPFLSDTKRHDFVVVHGHTIVAAVDDRENRIAIDTGAYQTGILSAIVIENETRRYLATGPAAATTPTSALLA